MAINLNDNLNINAPKSTDARFGPYASTAAAIAALDSAVRYQGLTVAVTGVNGVEEYWFASGIADGDLVSKLVEGAAGAQGTQGVQGTQGLQGIQGVQGVQGTQGTQGVQGTQGTQGTQGVQGVQGAQGLGAQGTQGTQGVQGTQGTQGVQGVQGAQGAQGSQGTQGVQGVQGSQGTQGVQGVQGVEGPVAGSANQVVYKDGGNAAAGSANFTFDESTNELTVAGTFSATTKSFLIKHPTPEKDGMLLRYSSLESPFHGVRLSGRVTVDGSAVVDLPDYVKDLVHNSDDENLSIQLTGIRTTNPISVGDIDVAKNRFTVHCDSAEPVECFWTFTATRKDVAPLIVEF